MIVIFQTAILVKKIEQKAKYFHFSNYKDQFIIINRIIIPKTLILL